MSILKSPDFRFRRAPDGSLILQVRDALEWRPWIAPPPPGVSPWRDARIGDVTDGVVSDEPSSSNPPPSKP